MTVKLYAYYGVLAHEGRAKFSTRLDREVIHDVWEVEIPESLHPYLNTYDVPCVEIEGRPYWLDELLDSTPDSEPRLRVPGTKWQHINLTGHKM